MPTSVFVWHLSQPCARWTLMSCAGTGTASHTIPFLLPNVLVALTAAGVQPDGRHLDAAARFGCMSACRWFIEDDRLGPDQHYWSQLLSTGARSGHRAICDWCLDQAAHVPATGKALSSHALVLGASSAACGGYVALMTWLLQLAEELAEAEAEAGTATEALRKKALRDELVPATLAGCDLPTVLQLSDRCGLTTQGIPPAWKKGASCALANALRSRGKDWREKAEWLMARAGGDWGFGDWDVQQRLACAAVDHHPLEEAAERLTWLGDKGCPYEPCALACVITSGNTPALRWLLANGLTPDSLDLETRHRSDVGAAAARGHVAMLEALRQATSAWSLELWGAVLTGAAGLGCLVVLRWAAAQLGPDRLARLVADRMRDASVFNAAVKSGCAEAMRWVYDVGVRSRRGCAMEEFAWTCAVLSRSEAAVAFLAEVDCPQPRLGEPYQSAIEGRDWHMLPALAEAGLDFGPTRTTLYARALCCCASAQVLQWLAEEAGVDARAGEAEAGTVLREYLGSEYDSDEEEAEKEEEEWAEAAMEATEEGMEAEVTRRRRRRERGWWWGPEGRVVQGRGRRHGHHTGYGQWGPA
ncbi:hypothetical protein HYH03_016224 [Edaphochlamys debaryana]|uniref:Ankyrin repeat protein n=1 Tax=Edaphochlamys debaryana TaxID=47281 RepID=A0A836BQ44_9CHLO|nr:hypothetical protein HYH03_016224 [Edaphochlamys debaryana]|eukprot:KAG2485021.1 hypothetical protein HYH03_016224 [Edaphochlamys debaryana]